MLLRAQTCENRPLALRPIRLVTPPPRTCGGGD
jgi:aspartate aminotransferase